MAHIVVFEEKRGVIKRRKQYRWRVVARNGRIIASSGEGYNNLGDLWKAVRAVTDALAGSLGRPVPVHDAEEKLDGYGLQGSPRVDHSTGR